MTTIHSFKSVGDWEGLYIDGELVKENHIGRVDVLSYLEEGMEIETVVSTRVNLPEGRTSYPTSLDEVIEDDGFDYEED
jgi:hypothetical protein